MDVRIVVFQIVYTLKLLGEIFKLNNNLNILLIIVG